MPSTRLRKVDFGSSHFCADNSVAPENGISHVSGREDTRKKGAKFSSRTFYWWLLAMTVFMCVAVSDAESAIFINFAAGAGNSAGNPIAPVPAGYMQDIGEVFGYRGNGFNYGWNRNI